MTAYYNDNDPRAAATLRELIRAGLIAPGEVDDRSLLDVEPGDLGGFTQCHFFAGLGGWSRALRLAGWPDDEPVWTGSPPCQPFSVAGRSLSRDDPRHLSPKFVELVRACRPPVLFGEQVASAAVFGKAAKRTRGAAQNPPEWAWLDDLSDRLEAAHYAVGASDIPAAGIGAPHIRQRTFFGAYDLRPSAGWLVHGVEPGLEGHAGHGDDRDEPGRDHTEPGGPTAASGGLDRVAAGQPPTHPTHGFWGDADWLFSRDGRWRPVEPGTFPLAHGVPARVGRLHLYGNAIVPQVAEHFIRAYREALHGLHGAGG